MEAHTTLTAPAFAGPVDPRRRARRWVWVAAGAIIFLVTIAGVLVGPVAVPADAIGRIILSHLLGLPLSATEVQDQIVWDVRLPRVLAAVAVVAVVRNPLGDPYVIGVTPGASLGAVTAIVLGTGIGVLGIVGSAFIGVLVAFVALARSPAEVGAGRRDG